MKIVYAAYRSWAMSVVPAYNKKHKQQEIVRVTTQERLENLLQSYEPDVIFLAGWSWKIPDEWCQKYVIVGMHPSDLPSYAGGSPIQHQIIDGLLTTKATLLRITPQLDAGPIIFKEPLSLLGDMATIYNELTIVTKRLLDKFIDTYPNFPECEQKVNQRPLKRLKPEDSCLNENIHNISAIELYNFCRGRCGVNDYPKPYFQDETGKFIISAIEFQKNEQK